MTEYKLLFSPVKIGKMELKNRIIFPPMYSRLATEDGYVTQKQIDYYEVRAAGGAAMLTVDAVRVNKRSKFYPNSLGLFDDDQIPGWKKLCDAIHSHGAKVSTQMLHPGPSAGSMHGTVPVGPSPVWASDVRETPQELSLEEIKVIIGEYAEAVRRGKEAGLDSVQLHAAHGYSLIGSFMSPYFNKRTDEYGGSVEDRIKILLDIIKAIKAKVGQDFPITVRISGDEYRQGSRGIAESQFIAPIIEEAGADALEISAGIVPDSFWQVIPPTGTPPGLNANAAEAIKQVVNIPVIAVGKINTPRVAEFILKTGKADIVGIARQIATDPDFPKKAFEGRLDDIVPCMGDNLGCLFGHPTRGHVTCLMNPARARERECVIEPTENPKKILVAGGGPAGLEAARVAANRGHDVTLMDKAGKLGGQINLACVPPMKQEFSRMIKYLSHQVKKEGVKIELGKEVTADTIDELKPDAVIVATGAVPLIPDNIPGIDGDNVVSAWDVLAGKVGTASRNVVIVGGGAVGSETADYLARIDDNASILSTKVTIVEMKEEIAMDMGVQPREILINRLRERDVDVLKSTTVKEIHSDSVTVEKKGRLEKVEDIDLVVLAMGATSVNQIAEIVKDKVAEVHVIGDAKKPRMALEAIDEGREIGRTI
jgi:NAD(H)-dependent 7beta-hydroxy-3-oxo-delta4-cholenoic acid oxidoreductase